VNFECISDNNSILAYLIRNSENPDKTSFITPPYLNFQAGFIIYPDGSEIPRHFHHPVQRSIQGTSEVIFVREGACIVDIYTSAKELIASRSMEKGDIVMFVSGGHGFRITEKTVLFEIKQGPYPGAEEKERF
jgi:mannose-6-phosphate isomerase-like protein (cupin superfamily)